MGVPLARKEKRLKGEICVAADDPPRPRCAFIGSTNYRALMAEARSVSVSFCTGLEYDSDNGTSGVRLTRGNERCTGWNILLDFSMKFMGMYVYGSRLFLEV